MAEEAKKKSEADTPDKKGGKEGIGGLLTKTPVMLGGVMILEAVVLFAGFKFVGGGPQPSAGAELTAEAAQDGSHGAPGEGKASIDKKKSVELQVLEFRAPNKISGRTFIYDVSIFLVTKAEHEEMVKKTIEERAATIRDRVRTIIAQSDPEKLTGGAEPGLETLRRQVKYQLDEILGEGIVEEVLIPRCIPFRTDY